MREEIFFPNCILFNFDLIYLSKNESKILNSDVMQD